MSLTDLITKLTEIEQRHIGHRVHVELGDDESVMTADIEISTEHIFAANSEHSRITVRLRPTRKDGE